MERSATRLNITRPADSRQPTTTVWLVWPVEPNQVAPNEASSCKFGRLTFGAQTSPLIGAPIGARGAHWPLAFASWPQPEVLFVSLAANMQLGRPAVGARRRISIGAGSKKRAASRPAKCQLVMLSGGRWTPHRQRRPSANFGWSAPRRRAD